MNFFKAISQALLDFDNGALMQGKTAKAIIGYFGDKEKLDDFKKFEKDRLARAQVRAEYAGAAVREQLRQDYPDLEP